MMNNQISPKRLSLTPPPKIARIIAYVIMYKITNTITVPKSGDDNFEDEKSHMVFFKERVGGRSNDTVEMKIETFVSLDKNGKGVKIKTRFDNEVKE